MPSSPLTLSLTHRTEPEFQAWLSYIALPWVAITLVPSSQRVRITTTTVINTPDRDRHR
jgi:hypothetical protein